MVGPLDEFAGRVTEYPGRAADAGRDADPVRADVDRPGDLVGRSAAHGVGVGRAVRTVARDIALAGPGPVADAAVTQRTLNSKGPGVASFDVRFVTADGRQVRGTVYEFRKPAPVVGAKLLVRYNAAHPGWYVRNAASGPSVWRPAALILLGLALAALGTVQLARPRAFDG